MALLVVLLGLAPSAARAQVRRPPCASCLAVVIGVEDQGLLPAALHGLRVLVRVESGREVAGPLVEAIRRQGGSAGLLVRGLPTAPLPPELSAIDVLISDVRALAATPDDVAFELKTRLTALRGTAPRLRLGVALPEGPSLAALARELAPYIDFLAVRSIPESPTVSEWWQDAGEVRDLHSALELTRATAADTLIVKVHETALAGAFHDLTRAIPFIPSALIDAPDVAVSCRGLTAEVWMRPSGRDASVAYSGHDYTAWAPACRAGDALQVPPGFTVTGRADLLAGGVVAALSRVTEARFASGIEVAAERTLTVEEIIAKHQAADARQKALVRRLISSGTLTLTFEAPGFPAPVTVTSDSIIYTDAGSSEIQQRSLRVNGIDFKSRGVPRLPLIEPERVASPPLAIALTDAYRYELDGVTDMNGTRCYVVAFEPLTRAGTFFKGRAWIDTTNFGIVRVAASQTGLRGSIVASEQVDDFVREPGDLWLLRRSHVRQLYEGAAHRTPIDRVLTIERHEVNPEDFASRRIAAYASDAVMLRDTPAGYRYLEKVNEEGRRAGDPEPSREIRGRANRVRTMIVGALVDPNISRPLPFAGLSYVDFDLLGTGAQFNGFFGGTYGQLAISVPSLAGSRWQLGGRAFGIVSSYNDRSFDGGLERYEENISQRPAHGSVWLVRPLTPRLLLRAGYELDYTHFAANDTTSPTFIVPADQVVHGLRVSADAQRGGWRAAAWWNPAHRSGWRRWGDPDAEYDPAHEDFQRGGVSLTRIDVLSPALVLRGEASWMAGRDLDRFSRFAFGAFDNRLRGFPAALIRYDGGAVLRGAAAWSLGPRMRLDGFIDTAFVHDPGLGTGVTPLTGFGMAVEAPAPFGTLVAVEWGFGIQGRRTNGGRGTHVVRITGYKVF